jgi:hypothetical protein
LLATSADMMLQWTRERDENMDANVPLSGLDAGATDFRPPPKVTTESQASYPLVDPNTRALRTDPDQLPPQALIGDGTGDGASGGGGMP